MLLKVTKECAKKLFQHAELGDERRTKRLIKISLLVASNTRSSIVKASGSQMTTT